MNSNRFLLIAVITLGLTIVGLIISIDKFVINSETNTSFQELRQLISADSQENSINLNTTGDNEFQAFDIRSYRNDGSEERTGAVLGADYNEAPSYTFKELLEKRDEETEVASNFEATTYKLQESGWVPVWSHNSGIQTSSENPGRFSQLLPVWYGVDKAGNVINRKPSNFQDLITHTSSNDIKLIPTISSFDDVALSSLLRNPEQRSALIQYLDSEAATYGYDGIDLNFEAINAYDKDLFYVFADELNSSLKGRDMIFSITVFAKTRDYGFNTGNIIGQTRYVQDYAETAAISDQVRIMAYDFSTTNSTSPGPVAPKFWLVDILGYALESIPREKLWLGVNLYGYEWAPDKNTAVRYKDVQAIKDAYPIISEFVETTSDEAVLNYNCGGTCTVRYQSPETLHSRLEMASQLGIAGVSYWSIGDEGTIFLEESQID